MRRTLPTLAAIGLLAVGTAGCGDEPSSMGAAHIESNVAHPRATEAEGVAGAEIITHVGAELYGPIADAADDGNVAYSPLSIGVTLGMARAGADGESAEQLDAFFGDADPATIGDLVPHVLACRIAGRVTVVGAACCRRRALDGRRIEGLRVQVDIGGARELAASDDEMREQQERTNHGWADDHRTRRVQGPAGVWPRRCPVRPTHVLRSPSWLG